MGTYLVYELDHAAATAGVRGSRHFIGTIRLCDVAVLQGEEITLFLAQLDSNSIRQC